MISVHKVAVYFIFYHSTAVCDENKEFYCQHGCRSNVDQCRKNQCIPQKWINDQRVDCKQGTDECK